MSQLCLHTLFLLTYFIIFAGMYLCKYQPLYKIYSRAKLQAAVTYIKIL